MGECYRISENGVGCAARNVKDVLPGKSGFKNVVLKCRYWNNI